jgi:hypothetical protein
MAQLGDGAEAVRIVADVPGELGDLDITHRVEGQVCRVSVHCSRKSPSGLKI